jgi:hypothetical protein
MPRHPPCALNNLENTKTNNTKKILASTIQNSKNKPHRNPRPHHEARNHSRPKKTTPQKAGARFLRTQQRAIQTTCAEIHNHHTDNPTTGPPQRWLLRKEVIQPHLPVRLPCYDFVLIASPTFDHSPPHQKARVRPWASGVTDFHDVTGGVYKARERIHRSNADLRLLATPTSRGRVADPDPN